ncbi:MAG: ROK family protein [Chloroflexota bacterium]|nr:ROK family protein [Chloroflexota bacterium]
MVQTRADAPVAIPDEILDALVSVLDVVRHDAASTRPEIIRRTGLGRGVIVQRVGELIGRGLLVEAGLGPSSGGRAPRTIRLNARAGHILVADLGATSIGVGIADLSGQLVEQHEEPADITAGPEAILGRVDELFAGLRSKSDDSLGDLWGIGIGVPGPVEFATGRPVSPPIMPGWDDYPVRERFSTRHSVPVWVDNDVNLMALGEYRAGVARGHDAAIFIKVGTGIGAGIIIDGKLHRGSQGSAGDVGHIQVTEDPSIICRCGNIGCLEAIAGGAALARDGTQAAHDGRSRLLARLLGERGRIEATEVGWAAAHGDAVSRDLIATAGRRIGLMVATLVNALNPSLVVIGGGVSGLGDPLIAAVRETVYGRSLPLATRELRIVRSSLNDEAGRIGAASIVVDELFSRARISTWLSAGSPAGLADHVTLGSH